jgi:LPXTG-motif cell wall-anchored protein
VLPDLIGRDVDLREVRAVADLARLENWHDISFFVLPRIRDKTPHHEVASRGSMRHIVKKLAILSPYLALIGLVSVVSGALVFRRRKSSRQ